MMADEALKADETIKVRAMVLEDVPRVYEIEVASFKTPWTVDAFEKEITTNQLAIYHVITVDYCIVGFAGMWAVIDELHITNIAIAPDYRGKGLSNLLMQALFDYAQTNQFASMTLEVRTTNAVAIGLYEKYNFVTLGVRKGYYLDTGEDALIMWKEF